MIAHSIFLKCGEEKKNKCKKPICVIRLRGHCMAKCDGSCWKGRYCFAGDLLWKRTCQEMIADQFIGKTITFRHVCQPHFWYNIEKYTAGEGSWHRQDTRTLGATIQCLVGQRQSLLDENFNLNAVPGGNCSSYLHGQFVRETLS